MKADLLSASNGLNSAYALFPLTRSRLPSDEAHGGRSRLAPKKARKTRAHQKYCGERMKIMGVVFVDQPTITTTLRALGLPVRAHPIAPARSRQLEGCDNSNDWSGADVDTAGRTNEGPFHIRKNLTHHGLVQLSILSEDGGCLPFSPIEREFGRIALLKDKLEHKVRRRLTQRWFVRADKGGFYGRVRCVMGLISLRRL